MSKSKVSRQVPENVAKRKFGIRGVHWDYEDECAPVEAGANQQSEQQAGEVPQAPLMRAKLRVANVIPNEDGSESISFNAVAMDEAYPADGSDENNTYARFTPVADLDMLVNNPALSGKLKVGQEFYVDFIVAFEPEEAPGPEQQAQSAEDTEVSSNGTADGAAEAGESSEPETTQGSDQPATHGADEEPRPE